LATVVDSYVNNHNTLSTNASAFSLLHTYMTYPTMGNGVMIMHTGERPPKGFHKQCKAFKQTKVDKVAEATKAAIKRARVAAKAAKAAAKPKQQPRQPKRLRFKQPGHGIGSRG
jgi:hypothetical protein